MRSWVALGMDFAAGAPLSTREIAAADSPRCAESVASDAGPTRPVPFPAALLPLCALRVTGKVLHGKAPLQRRLATLLTCQSTTAHSVPRLKRLPRRTHRHGRSVQSRFFRRPSMTTLFHHLAPRRFAAVTICAAAMLLAGHANAQFGASLTGTVTDTSG